MTPTAMVDSQTCEHDFVEPEGYLDPAVAGPNPIKCSRCGMRVWDWLWRQMEDGEAAQKAEYTSAEDQTSS